MANTKSEIIKHSVVLFNKKGFFNTSIKDIADTMGISPGNFTYHFKRKEHLLSAIQDEIVHSAVDIMPSDQYITLFHFEEMFRKFNEIQQKYRFFFLDILYLMAEYPSIMNRYKIATARRFEDARKLVDHYIITDRLVPEDNRIAYNIVVRALWMTSTFWNSGTTLMQQKNTEATNNSPLSTLWGILIPYLTEKGYAEYQDILRYNTLKTNTIL